MTWWVLTSSKHFPRPTSLRVLATTNLLDHLFMAWSYYQPSRTPIYRTIRGLRVHCGYKYVWDTPFIAEQTQSGDTFTHTFDLSALTPATTIWYYLFAPGGPGNFQIQGPLQSVKLPLTEPWPWELYVATRQKGFFYTRTFTGPHADQPTWKTFNDGLHSLHIWQLEPDPLDPAACHFCIAGNEGNRTVYRRRPAVSPAWTPILTLAQARATTFADSGTFRWVAANSHFPGYLYVLFSSTVPAEGVWCIRSTDYGDSWMVFQIDVGLPDSRSGNIMAGLAQGTSPHAPGTVLYAAISTTPIGPTEIWLSLDHGATWNIRCNLGAGTITPRCLVDPTNQAILYFGFYTNPIHPHELARSEDHGAAPVEIDDPHHLGILIDPYYGSLWIWPVDHRWLRVLHSRHVWQTTDYCLTWTDLGETMRPTDHLLVQHNNPDHQFLARFSSTEPHPFPHGPHVLHVSEDDAAVMWEKAGRHAGFDDGGDDSIPWNCGGVSHQGIMPLP